MTEIERRRVALFALFFILGLSMGSWVTRAPAIKEALGASIAEMGMVLFGFSTGSMCGILASSAVVNWKGTRTVIIVGSVLSTAALAALALGCVASFASVVWIGFFLFGNGMAFTDMAVNIDGAHVEAVTRRPLLHFVHGYFSLGTAFGALAGMGMSGVGFPVWWQLLITAGTSVPLLVHFIRDLPQGSGRAESARAETGGLEHVQAVPVWKDQRLLMIGLIMLVLALTEGVANDWLPIIMVDEYGVGAVSSSLTYFGFSTAMTVGRFSGGYFLKGRLCILQTS